MVLGKIRRSRTAEHGTRVVGGPILKYNWTIWSFNIEGTSITQSLKTRMSFLKYFQKSRVPLTPRKCCLTEAVYGVQSLLYCQPSTLSIFRAH